MKDLKQFILEGKKHVDQATVADFFQMVCLHELPNGKCDKKRIKDGDVIGLLDNGWFENFGDAGPKEAQKVRDFFDKNWDENIKVISEETPNDWEISFTLNGKTYSAAFQTYFGNLSHF